MVAWNIYVIALAAVLLQAWMGRKGRRDWYLDGIVPLLYGGVVAWMFVGKDFLLALRIILCGTALPILLLLWAWRDSRTGDQEASENRPRRQGPPPPLP